MDSPPIGLLAAIQARYLDPAQWIRWADTQIARSDQPADWIIDLSVARDHDQAWAIGPAVLGTSTLPANKLDEITLGLIALRYFEGRIGFKDFLLHAGDHTDPSSCSLDCEYFYTRLAAFESALDPTSYEQKASDEIRESLKQALSLAEIAKTQIAPITEQGADAKPDNVTS